MIKNDQKVHRHDNPPTNDDNQYISILPEVAPHMPFQTVTGCALGADLDSSHHPLGSLVTMEAHRQSPNCVRRE